MRPRLKVVVDECVGLDSRLFEAFRAWLGDRTAEFLYLSEAHPGIPDVEILDKLLGPAVILLTNDRVLHNRACASQLRSFTLNEQQQLTRRPLKEVRTPCAWRIVSQGQQAAYQPIVEPIVSIVCKNSIHAR